MVQASGLGDFAATAGPKVLAVLQDGDAALASAIASSRELIPEILRGPKKFADTVA